VTFGLHRDHRERVKGRKECRRVCGNDGEKREEAAANGLDGLMKKNRWGKRKEVFILVKWRS